MDISKVEAAAIFSLTSTSSMVRQAALYVIELCNELAKSQPKIVPNTNNAVVSEECKNDDGSASHSMCITQSSVTASTTNGQNNSRWPDVRLQEIIKAIENDIKERFKHQYKIGNESEIKSINDLANGESPEDQLEWTMCLVQFYKSSSKRCRCLKFAGEW